MIWFNDVPSFPPHDQAVVGVISGVLNSRNAPAFTATSKSTVCLYRMSMRDVVRTFSSSVLCIIVVICICVFGCVLSLDR